MVRLRFVDPTALPDRVPAIALHKHNDVLLVLKEGLTNEEIEHWISHLGGSITREAIDATIARSETTTQPEMRLREMPQDLPHPRPPTD